MSKTRLLLHTISIAILSIPNMIYLGLNFEVLKEANAISLTLTALLVLAIVGCGTLAHFKPKTGIWVLIIGIFVLSLSNIAYVAGFALMIEGAGLILDQYLIHWLITKQKIKELEADGKSITYTREIK